METNSQPCDVHLPLQSIDNIQMLALSPTSSPVKKKLKSRARSHNEAIKLGINTPLNTVDMSLLEKPVLQPLRQLSHNHYNQLRSHSLAEFHILPSI